MPPSNSAERVPALDGWRGVAVLTLLLGHFVPACGLDAPPWSANFGRVGVELFFALSGCLMSGMLFSRPMPLGRFAVRRFARIVPSLWVYAVVAAGLTLAREAGLSRLDVVLAAAGGLNLAPALGRELPPVRLGHLWSVCLELQGYVVLGAVAAASRRKQWPPHLLLGLLALASLALIAWTGLRHPGSDYYGVYWLPQYRLVAMLLSALIVHLHDEGRLALDRLPAWPLWMTAGLGLQINWVPDAVKYSVGSACLALACAGIARAPGRYSRWLGAPWLVALGTVSYSIYLWQQLFYAEKAPLHWPVALLLALAAGFVAHHAWDHRLHRWSTRVLERALTHRV